MPSCKVLPQGGGNADRLRRAEAEAAAKRRQVPSARNAASRSRREDSQPGDPPIPVPTGTARRSYPQEKETVFEGSDGEHSPPSPGPADARAKLTLRQAEISGAGGFPSGPFFGPPLRNGS